MSWTPAHYEAFILWLTWGEPQQRRVDTTVTHYVQRKSSLFFHGCSRPDVRVLALALTCRDMYALFDGWRVPLYEHCGRYVLFPTSQYFTFAHLSVYREWGGGTCEVGIVGRSQRIKLDGTRGRRHPKGKRIRVNVVAAMVGDEAWREEEEPTASTA